MWVARNMHHEPCVSFGRLGSQLLNEAVVARIIWQEAVDAGAHQVEAFGWLSKLWPLFGSLV